jgi:hypothetical protein
MQALVPPAMIEIDAVGAIAILQLKRSITPMSAASGQGPRYELLVAVPLVPGLEAQ